MSDEPSEAEMDDFVYSDLEKKPGCFTALLPFINGGVVFCTIIIYMSKSPYRSFGDEIQNYLFIPLILTFLVGGALGFAVQGIYRFVRRFV
jgi:hypothetical protein